MWLGIDIGTGGSRALLVDGGGRVRAGYTAAHEDMRMERPMWAEQRPENWWDASVDAVRGALAAAGISGRDVKCIGLSGQMHGLVILDEAGRVIRPVPHLVRPAVAGAGGFRPRQIGTRDCAGLHREPGVDGVHAAEAAMGARP